jgi:glycosyltransferase involved in cell wall biosynthesis
MIVKNEAHVIKRCLDSALPFIDSWSIVDTGSTDGTQGAIKEHLAHLPGELHERPWRDFGHNRTEAIELALGKADYQFFLDADEELIVPEGFAMPTLKADAYSILMGSATNRYWREILVSDKLPWRYEGVLHEYLTTDKPYKSEKLPGPFVIAHFDGGRGLGLDIVEKYRRDAAVLEQAVKDEPENRRYVFYLAQSYRDSGQIEKSIETYQRRALMGGWDEEVWFSLFQAAKLSERLNVSPEIVASRFLAAYQFRPQRAEALVFLAAHHRERKQYALAHLYAERAIAIPMPGDILFLDESCYAWRAKDEYSIACYYTGRFAESKKACEVLLGSPDLPDSERKRVADNLTFALGSLPGDE